MVSSSVLAIAVLPIQYEIYHLEEMMKASVRHASKDDCDLREALEIRYGLSKVSLPQFSAGGLTLGALQVFIGAIAVISLLAIVAALLALVLAVQLFTLREIYLHPNFSKAVSIGVIGFVITTDLFVLCMTLLIKSWQPYRTYEDLNRLSKLNDRDQKRYDAIITEIVREHRAKGWIRRIITRPKMKRIT